LSKPVREETVLVANQYKKKNHFVLKLKNDEITFYTVAGKNLKNLLNQRLKIKIITKNVTFYGYLRGFFAPSFDYRLLPESVFGEFLEKQHKNEKIANLYKALFLGKSMDYETRKELSTLGISYLFALSGMHLGFIGAILFFVLSPIYKFFQKRFFPYRNRFFDLGILILTMEFLYLGFTSFPPSLIRAYVLEIFVFAFFYFYESVLSLKVLFYTLLSAFLIFFAKIISLGFLLSFVGVYYIYLYFRHLKANLVSGFLLSFYMFFVMFVWGHAFFGNFSIWQLSSPLVNIVFPIFYVVSFVLHLLGMGGLFDGALLKFLRLGDSFVSVKVSLWFLVFFSVLSMLAWKKKYAFYGINILGILTVLTTLGG
jgi:competence protein ComEC